MEHRCKGSCCHPRRWVTERRGSHEVKIGQCKECGAWRQLLQNGMIRAHVNWAVRTEATQGPRK